MKKYLGRIHFPTEKKLKEEILSYLWDAVGEFYDSGIKKIMYRMQKCIDINGY